MEAKEIARYITLRLEKEEGEGHGAYCSPDVEETGCEYDGFLNVLEIVEWVLEKVNNG